MAAQDTFAEIEGKVAAHCSAVRRQYYSAVLSTVEFESGPYQGYTYQGVLDGITDGLLRHPELIEGIAQQVDQLIKESVVNETPEAPEAPEVPAAEATDSPAVAPAGAGGAPTLGED